MEVVVSIQHPAHVHFYKHAIGTLRDRGHGVHVYALDKDVTLDLLDSTDIDYTALASRGADDNVAVSQLRYEYRLLRAAKRHRPDVVTATWPRSSTPAASSSPTRNTRRSRTDSRSRSPTSFARRGATAATSGGSSTPTRDATSSRICIPTGSPRRLEGWNPSTSTPTTRSSSSD